MGRGQHWIQAHLSDLLNGLSTLPDLHQVAFASSCCERLYLSYQALMCFLGEDDHKTLRECLDRLWGHVLGTRMSTAEVAALRSECSNLPLGDEGCCIHRVPAMIALDGVLHALESCTDASARSAVGAASSCIDQIDDAIMAQVWQLYDRPIGPEDFDCVERQVNSHPAMVAELRRQKDVVAFLQHQEYLGDREVQLIRSMT
jgi:hypothetical protein